VFGYLIFAFVILF